MNSENKEIKMTHDQHFVPQMYLKHFADGKLCYVIEGHGKITKKSIDRICYKTDYYELKNIENKIVKHNLIESQFLNRIETMYTSYFEELFMALNNQSIEEFKYKDDNDLKLIIWLILMFLRNPLVFKETPEAAKEIGIEWDEIQAHNNAVINMVGLLEEWSNNLRKTHRIVFLKNNSDISFVTSNYPSIITRDSNGQIRGEMPLSPEYYMLLLDKGNGIKEDSIQLAPKILVNYHNYNTVVNTFNLQTDVEYKYIISKDKKTLEFYKDVVEELLKG